MEATVSSGQPFALGFALDLAKSDMDRREVWGWASFESPDKQGDVVDFGGAKDAFAKWFPVGNIREQHDPKRAIGKAVGFEPDEARRGIYLGVRLSKTDDGERALQKVKEGILTGFSIGGVATAATPEIVKTDSGMRTFNRIKAMRLSEVSLCDNPAHPDAKITLVKSDGAEAFTATDLVDAVEAPAAADAATETEQPVEKTDAATETANPFAAAIEAGVAAFRQAAQATAATFSPETFAQITKADGEVPTKRRKGVDGEDEGDEVGDGEKDSAAGAQGSATGDGAALPVGGQPRQAGSAAVNKADGADDSDDEDEEDDDSDDKDGDDDSDSKRDADDKDDDSDDDTDKGDDRPVEKADLATLIRKSVVDAISPLHDQIGLLKREVETLKARKPAPTVVPPAATPSARPLAKVEQPAFVKAEVEQAIAKALGGFREALTQEVGAVTAPLLARLEKLEGQPDPTQPAPVTRVVPIEKTVGNTQPATPTAQLDRVELERAIETVIAKTDNPWLRQELGALNAYQMLRADMGGGR